MSNPIINKFNSLREKNKKGLITFITGGDPNIDTSYRLIEEMLNCGVDIVEIGIPFSDPVAEGPTIEKANMRALKAGTSTDDIFDLVKKLRKDRSEPLVFMLYINLVYRYGTKKFIDKCVEVGINGLIIPDLPLEEIDEVKEYTDKSDILLINLVAPTTNESRLQKIIDKSEGFIYCVSSLGVTGVRSSISTDLENFYKRIRSKTKLPLALGFGLSSKEHIKSIKGDWDAFIIGSKIVNIVAEYGGDSVEKVGDFVRDIKELE